MWVFRGLAWMCTAAWLLWAVGPAGAQGLTVAVEAPPETEADTVQVKVNLSQVASLSGLFFDLIYPGTSLSLQGVDATGALAAQGLFATNPEQFPSSSGRVRFGFLHADGIQSDGTFVTLTFRLAPEAPSPIALTLVSPLALDNAAQTLATTTRDGAVVILLGVVNLKTGFQLFTVPVRPANPDPAAVLGEPAESVKLAAWDPSAKEGQGDYVVYTGGNLTLAPGIGYWIRREADRQVRLTQGTRLDGTLPFRISLPKGWSLIGNPFRGAVLWDLSQIRVRRGLEEKTLAEAQASGWVEDYAWIWRRDESNPLTGHYTLVYDQSVLPGVASEVGPSVGCWFLAHEACELVLPPPAGRSRVGRRREGAKGTWAVRLQARTHSGSAEVLVGLAGEGGRALAIVEPPLPPTGEAPLRVTSLRGGVPLSVDVRSQQGEREEWSLLVSGGTPEEEVALSWPDLRALPKEVRLTLEDESTHVRRYLRTTSGYTVRLGEQPRRLRLIAEPHAGPAIAITNLEVVGSGRAGRIVRFHLSAAASVEVDVISPSGRLVRRLVAGRAMEAGANEVAWPAGTLPGIYLVRVLATTEEGASAQGIRPVVLTR